MSKESFTPWLSDDQVFCLNEKHGWFQYGDAQSDVSRAFAQDAITMHESVRSAAPDLYAVAEYMEGLLMNYEINHVNGEEISDDALKIIRSAIAKARGEAV